MAVYTDNTQFARAFLPSEEVDELTPAILPDPSLSPVLSEVFGEGELSFSPRSVADWPRLLLSEFSAGSQYDKLIQLARAQKHLPDCIACLAGSGSGFHGFKDRSWAAVPGNLHLSVHLAPQREIDRFEIAFTVLAALSVLDALDQIAGFGGEGRIKWVNDILLGDAKVGGVLAYTQTQGKDVSSAVLGIGMNLEVAPRVEPTLFVPRVSSVRELSPSADPCVRERFLRDLLLAMGENYRTLLREGSKPLVARYRERSVVIGEEVTVCSENSDRTLQVTARGRVSALGESLELILDGESKPVTTGRLILGRIEEGAEDLATGTGEAGLAPLVAKEIGL